jgi:uncharacterized repeat protein (TIGR03803 family)
MNNAKQHQSWILGTCCKVASVALALVILLVLASFTARPAQAQNFQVLYTFTGTPDGANPFNAPLLDVFGTLYGTASGGGVYGWGTVYKINREGKETVLYSFTGGADGSIPIAPLVPDYEGNFYSTTQNGGIQTSADCTLPGFLGCGVVFKVDASGHETVLYSFTGGSDGAWPQGVTMDFEGNLYGITFFGGDLSCQLVNTAPLIGCGVVYKLNKRGEETVLYTFTGGADGAYPDGFLTLDSAGNIYGVTVYRGNSADCSGIGCGTVFKLDKNGKLTTLHTFTGADGSVANGSLVLDAEGNLYGNTYTGGDLTCNPPAGCGVVFEITAAGRFRVLHTFTGSPDGAFPPMGLLGDGNGNFYGTTEDGGSSGYCFSTEPVYGCGVVYKLNKRGEETVLYTFTGTTDGALPFSGLIMDQQGNLYGNTLEGGNLADCSGFGCGTVFKLEPGKH